MKIVNMNMIYGIHIYIIILTQNGEKKPVIKQIKKKGTEIHHINKTMCFYLL